MASLSIRDVYKTYPNGVPVLKGVNIDIEDGQFLILVGGSGCGKSTLLNVLGCLDRLSDGRDLHHDERPDIVGLADQIARIVQREGNDGRAS